MEDKKDKILSKCNIVPVRTMVKYLRDGMITMEELRSNGLTSEREEEINILTCTFVLSDPAFLNVETFRGLSQYLNSTTIEKFVSDHDISLGYVYSYIASLWSKFTAGNDL